MTDLREEIVKIIEAAFLADEGRGVGFACKAADNIISLLRDSGSDRNGEDAAKTAAECEAAQSGPKAIAQTPHSQCSKPREDK